MSEVKTREQIEANLVTKAWNDNSFKQKLINKPKFAIAEEGINLPENIEVKVIEETPRTFYIVIPQPPMEDEELSEADLESVAGGRGGGGASGGNDGY